MKKLFIILVPIVIVAIIIGIFINLTFSNSPKEVTKTFLNAVEDANIPDAIECISATNQSNFSSFNNIPKNYEELIEGVVSHFDYNILSVSEYDNSASVTAKVRALDIDALYNEPQVASLSSQPHLEALENLEHILEENNLPMITTNVTFNLTETKNGWKITNVSTILPQMFDASTAFN